MIYIIIVFILSMLDVTTTHIGFAHGLGEANPLMDGVIQHWWGVMLKLFLALFSIVILVIIKERYIEKQIQIAFWLGFLFIVLVHLTAVIWNIIQILIMRGVIN